MRMGPYVASLQSLRTVGAIFTKAEGRSVTNTTITHHRFIVGDGRLEMLGENGKRATTPVPWANDQWHCSSLARSLWPKTQHFSPKGNGDARSQQISRVYALASISSRLLLCCPSTLRE